MKMHTIGTGEYGVMFGEGKLLKTRPLGAGVAVIIQDIKSKTSGLVHVALPDSHLAPERARDNPGYFADTAIPILLEAFADSGLKRDPSDYTVKLVGGANVIDRHRAFDLGTRVVNAVKETLETCKLKVAAQEVGGRFSRSVTIHVESGEVEMIAPGRESKFI